MGFMRSGGGLLVCHVDRLIDRTELNFQAWNFTTQFIPHEFLTTYLQSLETLSADIPSLVTAISGYNPQREIVLLTKSSRSIEISWLQNLVILPQASYWQVCDRWDEFMPDLPPPDRF
jgi:hypothetical protein